MAPIDLVDEKKTTSSINNTNTDCSTTSPSSSASPASAQSHTLLQILVNNKGSTNDQMDMSHHELVANNNVNLGNKSVDKVTTSTVSGETKSSLQRNVRSHTCQDNSGGEDDEQQFKNDNTSQEDEEEEEEVDENVSTASSYSTSSLSPMSDVTSSPPEQQQQQQQNGGHSTRLKAANHLSSSCSKKLENIPNESNEIGIAEEESSPTPTLTPSDKNIQSSNFTDDEKQHRFIEFYPSNTTNLTDSQLASGMSTTQSPPQVMLQPPNSLPIRPNMGESEVGAVATTATTMNESSVLVSSSSSIYVPSPVAAATAQQTQAIYSPNGLVTYHTSPPPIIYHHPMANGIYTNGYSTPGMVPTTASNPPPYSIISPNAASQPSELGGPILSLSPHNPIPTPDSASLATSPISSLPSAIAAVTSNMASTSPSSCEGGVNATTSTPSSTIYVHVDVGHVFQMQLGDEMKEVVGPAMIKIVNNDSTQPVPLQLTAPAPGQYVQQLLDENGMLQHIIISSNPPSAVMAPPPPSLTSQPVLAQQPGPVKPQPTATSNTIPTNAALIAPPPPPPTSHYAGPPHLIQNPYQQHITTSASNTLHHSHHYNGNKTSSTNGVNKPTYLHHNGGSKANKLHPSYSNSIPSPYGITYPVSSNNTATSNNGNNSSTSTNSTNSYALNPANNTTTLPVISSTPNYHHIHHQYHQYNQYNNNKSQAYLLSNSSNNNQQQQTPSPPSQSPQPPLPLLVTQSVGGQHFVNHHIDESIVNHHIHHHHHHQAVINSNNNNNLTSSIENCGESINSERFIGQGTTTTTNTNNTPSVTSNSVSPLSSSSCSSTSIGNGRVANEQHFTANSQNSNSRFRKPNQQQAYLIRPTASTGNSNSSLKSLRPANNKTYNNKYLSSPTGVPPPANRALNHKLYKHQQKYPVMMVNQQQQQQPVLQQSSHNIPPSAESHMTSMSKAHELIAKNMSTLTSLLTSRTQRPVLGEIDARAVVVFLAAIDMADYESIINDMTIDNDSDPADIESSANGDKNGGEIVADEVSNSSSRSSNLDEDTRAELRDKFQKIIYSLELASCGSVSNLSTVDPASSNFNTVFTAEAKDTTEVTLKDLKPNTKYLLRTFAALTNSCHGEYVPCPPMAFQTKPCEPDALQQPPKLCGQKKKNELTLKWAQGPALVDNGSKITNYILEYQEIKNPLSSSNSSSSSSDQCDEVLSHDHFEIAYKGPLKQATVKKLQPSTCYAFRVSAENAYGRGPCSPTAIIYTAGSVPPQPEAPSLVDSSVSTLTLTWRLPNSANSVDIQYELQLLDLNDPFNYNIYLTVYNGPSNLFMVSNLRRGNSVQQPPGFQFRVRAYNEEGYSPWSEARKFSTRPDRPQPPSKLRVTRLAGTNTGYKCVWEAPRDSGGAPVHTFTLEIRPVDNNNDDAYQQIYCGDQCEFMIDSSLISTLRPGCSYFLRVCCANESGQSEYSTEPVVFTVPAVLPGVCASPKLNTKPKSSMAQFRWSPPLEDGGSPILAYELRLCELDSQSVTIHKSNGDECSLTIDSLLPGRNYTAQLRAVSKLGPCREWSEPALEFTSGAGAPDAPQAPSFVIKSPTCLQVAWQEVNGNGAPIIEYRLEWAEKPSQQQTDNQNISFVQLYSGTAVRYELRGGFQAASRYLFRLQAVNANGASSAYSPIVDFLTPAQVPAQIHHVRVEEIRTESALVVWKQPSNNGSQIQSYNIDLIENNLNSSQPTSSSGYIVVHDSSESGESEHLLSNLQPDTVYKVRIQAANSVGVGQFSAVHKFRTKSYPPQAPTSIECISSTYNCIKLKWSTVGGSSSSNSSSSSSSSTTSASNTDQQIVYVLEMMAKPNKKHQESDSESRDENSKELDHNMQEGREISDEDVSSSNEDTALPFVQLYKGNVNAFKASKLNESTEYWFRVAACNEAGLGKWSDIFKFITTTAPPSVNKAPVINEITTNSCLVEWLPAKSASVIDTAETLEYCLQVKSSNDDYREVYRGASCSHRLINLDPNAEYYVRVCATRINTEPRLVSPFSPHAAFTTLRVHHKPLHNLSGRQKFGESSGSSTSLADSIINTQRTKKNGKSSIMSRLMSFLTPIAMNKKINENAKPQQLIQASIQQQQQKSVKQSKRVSRYQDVNSHLVSSSQKSSLNASSSSTTSNGVISGGSLLGIKRESADQYWALGMIIVLLAIAFVIAYLGMQFYDLSSIIQTDVESNTEQPPNTNMNHHRMSEF